MKLTWAATLSAFCSRWVKVRRRPNPLWKSIPTTPSIRQLGPEHARLEDWTRVLFDQAALSEGAPLPEPAAYVQRVNDLLTRAMLAGN